MQMFNCICPAKSIEPSTAKLNHSWTNGQVERMNRTINKATVKRYHYDSHDQIQMRLQDFTGAYDFARRVKTLKSLTRLRGFTAGSIHHRPEPSIAGAEHLTSSTRPNAGRL